MGEVSGLSAPEPLADQHDFGDFDCGEISLDNWLKRRARANQVSGASRTYVVCENNRVAGYYALASGVVTVDSAPGRFRRNMPDPIPVAILARLAVDHDWQGRGIGRALFRDAARRVSQAADVIGIRPEPERVDDVDGNAIRHSGCSFIKAAGNCINWVHNGLARPGLATNLASKIM
jgi:GNAT superfamily N-acetyltransferase